VHRAGHAWEQLVLPVKARHASVLLNPANLAPLAHPRNAIILYDAAALRDPAWYSRAYVAWQRAMLPALARRALHVVTVSEFSKGELVDLLGADPEKITVIPCGVDERFSPHARTAPRDRPYVLCVASHTARKNLAALGPTALALRERGMELVVVGGHRPQFTPEPGLDALTLAGYVDDAELPGLYAQAELFVLPSRYEGFGLPVIEAMAAGTPVVCTDAGALPETTGGAARLTPLDPEAIRDAVLAVLDDDAEKARLRTAGLARAALFTWDRMARELHALLER
jgi:glycosyltransferase involved in cell wall biosynthesis